MSLLYLVPWAKSFIISVMIDVEVIAGSWQDFVQESFVSAAAPRTLGTCHEGIFSRQLHQRVKSAKTKHSCTKSRS